MLDGQRENELRGGRGSGKFTPVQIKLTVCVLPPVGALS